MSNTVIKVENLSKQYQLGTIGSGTLYRDLQSWWAKVRGKEDPNTQLGKWDASQMESDKSFWALKDVSFEVKQGDVLGIIGRNGAGKSTLLKILSRVTSPSSGEIKIKGRVASLLEVGTGFHPELSGRENIYLNGTILGMRKAEIDRRFDEIVEFAEVEKFIDTPVKRYSSGMYVRLAFAVAAHLEPEILIVDEVLAVGDVQFQKKCMGRMGEIGKEGRTILFVSHNMAAVNNLCESAILLSNGKITSSGMINNVVQDYMNQLTVNQKNQEYIAQNEEFGLTLLKVDIINSEGVPAATVATSDLIAVRLLLKTDEFYKNLMLSIGINSYSGIRLTVFHTNITNANLILNKPYSAFLCIIPKFPLLPGRYVLDIKMVSGPNTLFWIPSALEIDVQSGDYYGTGRLPDSDWGGSYVINHTWEGITFTDLDEQVELSSRAIAQTKL